VRVEDESDAYLLKTYRTFFDEVCASDLVKVRLDKEPDQKIGRYLLCHATNLEEPELLRTIALDTNLLTVEEV